MPSLTAAIRNRPANPVDHFQEWMADRGIPYPLAAERDRRAGLWNRRSPR